MASYASHRLTIVHLYLRWKVNGITLGVISKLLFTVVAAHLSMAVMRLRFTGNGSDNYYIDLAREISIAQRRLARQKQTFTVLGGYWKDQDGSTAHFNTAPLTWVAKRAVNRGFSHWRKMIARTLADSDGAQTGKYNDFKVYLNRYHFDSNQLSAVDANGNLLGDAKGEWDYSTLTSEDPETGMPPDQFELHITGITNTAAPGDHSRIGLIQSWFQSRPEPKTDDPQMPATASTDPLANLFDAGDVDDDRLEVIMVEGDQAPYDENTAWGYSTQTGETANLQRMSSAQSSNSNPIVPVHGFQALCGLVQLAVTGASSAWELVLDVECNGVGF